jgi:transcriptional regulator with XRE-family HTH domain
LSASSGTWQPIAAFRTYAPILPALTLVPYALYGHLQGHSNKHDWKPCVHTQNRTYLMPRDDNSGPQAAVGGHPRPEGPAFADELKRLRIAAGLTQEESAARAGMTAQGISALERGLRRTPQRKTLELLSAALGLSGPNQAAFAALARGRQASPVADAQRGPVSGLPAQITPLVGRAEVVAAVPRRRSGAGKPPASPGGG